MTKFVVVQNGAVVTEYAGSQLGNPDVTPPAGYTEIADTDTRYAAWLALPKGEAVDTFRDTRLATGFADAVTGKTFQCDMNSLTFWTAIGASAQGSLSAVPAPEFVIIAADNTTVSLGPAAAYALTNGRIMPWVSLTMLYARTMKNNILAGNPPADITQGWP